MHFAKQLYSKTNRTIPLITVPFALIILTLSQVIYAQDSSAVLIDVSTCTNLETPQERYECFESQVESSSESSTPPITVNNRTITNTATSQRLPVFRPPTPLQQVTPREAPQPESNDIQASTEPTETTPDNFGFRTTPDKKDTELTSTVTAVRTLSPGRLLVTLENGQVWKQTVGAIYRIEVGHQIRIYPTRWGGSFKLSSEQLRGFIQVERVQ